MKLLRFDRGQGPEHGQLEGETITVLAGCPLGGIEPTAETVALSQVRLLAPVDPPNVLALGLNYRPHATESKMALPDRPLLFLKATTSVIGPGEAIVLPSMAPAEVDYEAELCLVIGRPARHVSEAEALDYVLGYTCGNDVSARNCQLREDTQWARGKSFDTFCPLGPWIETELEPDAVRVSSRLNGQVMQDAGTEELIFSCRHLISYLSRAMTLLPGTIIMTGTPEGVGFVRQPPVYLQPGDIIEVEIEGIGALSNPVVAE
jgi:2-keto-4-pentenoate hydratase/2-oxohepta-3-ene-1,7-dioic acid hydratase in catechol pathway